MEQKRIADGLKFFAVIVAVVGAVFFLWYAPELVIRYTGIVPRAAALKWPGLIIVWVIGELCYLALWEFWRICTRIGNDNSFCRKNAYSMRNIALLAFLAAVLMMAAGITLACFGLLVRIAAVKLFFMVFVACGLGVLCLALARLVETAAELKEENELTI